MHDPKGKNVSPGGKKGQGGKGLRSHTSQNIQVTTHPNAPEKGKKRDRADLTEKKKQLEEKKSCLTRAFPCQDLALEVCIRWVPITGGGSIKILLWGSKESGKSSVKRRKNTAEHPGRKEGKEDK